VTPARAGTTAVTAVLGATVLLLVLVTWAASIGPDRVVSGGHVERVGQVPTTASGNPYARNPLQGLGHHQRGDPPGWLGVVAFALEVLTFGVVLFLAVRLADKLRRTWVRRTRRRRRRRPENVDFEVVGSAARVTAAMAEDAAEQRTGLAFEGDPRNAIVASWHRFEQQAVRAGVERRSWQTTAEFVLDVLDRVGADRGAVSRLADLYREARFSDHPMTEEHRRAALAALDEIHGGLRAPTVAR